LSVADSCFRAVRLTTESDGEELYVRFAFANSYPSRRDETPWKERFAARLP
jgi:hypothetical protein